MLPENSYGVTVGLNPGPQYPVTSRLAQQVVDWAKADGLGNFRFQLDIQSMWRNQSDITGGSGWDFAPLDDAVHKLTLAGLTISFPIRGLPTWGLTNPTFQASDEPWFMDDPNTVLVAAKVLANRYNGTFNIPTYGPMRIHKLELANEEANIHFTQSTNTNTLNQAISVGNSVPNLAIHASTIAAPAGMHFQFGTSGVSSPGDKVKLSQPLAIGDLVMHIVRNDGTAYVASTAASNGSNITQVIYGLRPSIYAIYDGTQGVNSADSPTAQPARDPWFHRQTLLTCGPVLKAQFPWLRIGCGAVWWMWDNNFTDFILGLGDALQYVEFINFHYYSKSNDPRLGNGHTPSITTAITNMSNAAATLGFANIPIEVTEFGWSVPDEVSQATQNTWYSHFLADLKATQKVRRLYFYNYDSSHTPGGLSLYQWNNATSTYDAQPALATLKSFMAANPNIIPLATPTAMGAQGRATFKIATTANTAKAMSARARAQFSVAPPVPVPTVHATFIGRDGTITMTGRG